MKVLVTGATGFVGREVLRQLQPAGHSIRILARYPYANRVRETAGEFNAVICAGQVGDERSLAEALSGVEAVIHLVGIISELGTNTFEHVHVEGTRRVVQAALSTGVKRIVHMSALGTRPNAVSRYHQTKWLAEEAVRQSGLGYTIFRPSVIYGREDHFLQLFASMSRWSPVVPVLGLGENRLQPVAVEVVAGCFAAALVEPEALGLTFDLCGAQALTLNEMLRALLDVTERRRAFLHLPIAWGKTAASVLERIWPPLTGLAPPLTRDQLVMLQEDNVGDPAPARRVFGFKQETFREGLARVLMRVPHPGDRAAHPG